MASKFIVAVSGGVDSVVLFDMLVRGVLPTPNSQLLTPNFVVAHFDHGIRPESADDAAFVRDLAAKYDVPFETAREELGPGASEELARERRYAFLREAAKKHAAKIMTAHHADDMAETIAINLTRGTGWRGVAVLDSPDIERPLLGMRKQRLYDYAKARGLQWREDATNADTAYLRNAIRKKLDGTDSETVELLGLYRARQVALKRVIDNEAAALIGGAPYSRHFFTNVPDTAAVELLRAVFVRETGSSPTIPQRQQALHAIKTFAPGKRYEVAGGAALRFAKTTFVIDDPTVVH